MAANISFNGTLSFLVLLVLSNTAIISCSQESARLQLQYALSAVSQAKNWAQASVNPQGSVQDLPNYVGVALSDCAKLYDESEDRLKILLSEESYDGEDARTWLSGVLASHRTCVDSLEQKGFVGVHVGAQNLTLLVSEALAMLAKGRGQEKGASREPRRNENAGILTKWDAATSRADFVVARDGSGTHNTIKAAVAAVSRMGHNRPERVIIHVKAGVYNEYVEIEKHVRNVMLVGDGMGNTIITGSRNVPDGFTTLGSATFGVSGDGFWARDITFENTAGPQKHQAVALRVSSDHSVFYRCAIRGHQDTLFTHSLRQFYRDCHIYGTIDFIFGDAPVVIQNCDILVRRPMSHQANMITAQGRDDPHENTGISIHSSRVRPAPDFVSVKGSIRTYLGRPWKKYSRTVFIRTDLGDLVDPKGWTVWRGNYALSTLYYAEYMNTGSGASTSGRVRWPGFHVLTSPQQASQFTVRNFIQGDSWIPITGVPFWVGV